MDSSLLGKVIFLVVFIASFALISSQLDGLIEVSWSVQNPDTADALYSEYFDFSEWTPYPFAITPSIATNNAVPGVFDETKVTTFEKGGEADIKMGLVRNNYWFDWWPETVGMHNNLKDYLAFWTEYKGGLWFGKHHRDATVSLEDFLTNWDPSTNYSRVTFELRHEMTLYATYNNVSWPSFADAVQNNQWNLSVGNPMNITITDSNPWSVIGRILTFSLPGVPALAQAMIAVPFWTIVGIVILAIISRFIPGGIPGL